MLFIWKLSKMAKKPKDWDRVRLLFEQGKSLGDIEKETGINKGSVSREAKKCNWQKALLQPIEEQMARVVEDFATLSQPQRVIVANNVEKKLKAKGLIKQTSIALIERIAELIPNEIDMAKLKAGSDLLKTAMATTGIVSYYPPKETAEQKTSQSIQLEIIGVKSSNQDT